MKDCLTRSTPEALERGRVFASWFVGGKGPQAASAYQHVSLTYDCFERKWLLSVVRFLTFGPSLGALVELNQNVVIGVSPQGASTANNVDLKQWVLVLTVAWASCGSG